MRDIEAAIKLKKEAGNNRLVGAIAKGMLSCEYAVSFLSRTKIDNLNYQKELLETVFLDSLRTGVDFFEESAFSVKSIPALPTEGIKEQMINTLSTK